MRRRGCRFWFGRVLLVLIIALVVIVVLAAGYQAIASARDTRSYPPPGQLVDVGGHHLHIHCLGEGSPTVILEAGAGSASPMWAWIQSELANTTRVCAYDRAGFGWSEEGPAPRDGRQLVTELHTLLTNAGIAPPYVLTGHSLGGELVRLYAERYPGEVSGLALLDSSHPEQIERIPGLQQELGVERWLNLGGLYTAPLGLMRLYWGVGGTNPTLAPQERGQMRAFFATSRPYRTSLAESEARSATDAQVRATTGLDALPLFVLTQGDAGDVWMALQEELVQLSTNSLWRVVEGSTHIGLLTDFRPAQEAIAAIRQVVEAARTGEPLTE